MNKKSSLTYSEIHGEIITISASGYTATISEVGASLLELSGPSGNALILPVDPYQFREKSRGELLAPWPNRLEHGAYTWKGATLRVPINEIDSRNAIHGLVNYQRWYLGKPSKSLSIESESTSVSARLLLTPTPGYPFLLEFEVTYILSASGLTTRLTAINRGSENAPYAVGAHPYLVAGNSPDVQGAVDQWTLKLPASSYLDVNENMIPTQQLAVEKEFDFRRGKKLQGINLDHAFGELVYDSNGRGTVEVTDNQGKGVGMFFSSDIKWLQVFTDGIERRGIAIEPMTAPANCFNSGIGLIPLSVGGSHTASWTIYEIN